MLNAKRSHRRFEPNDLPAYSIIQSKHPLLLQSTVARRPQRSDVRLWQRWPRGPAHDPGSTPTYAQRSRHWSVAGRRAGLTLPLPRGNVDRRLAGVGQRPRHQITECGADAAELISTLRPLPKQTITANRPPNVQ